MKRIELKTGYRWVFPFAVLLFSVVSPPAQAARIESGVSFGPMFFSNSDTESMAPKYGAQVTYSAAQVLNPYLNWAHSFQLGLLMLGDTLAGQTMTYHGLSGTYTSGLRANFAKSSVMPYLEVGPALSIIALYVTGGSSSNNQTSLKYGYTITTGFDSLAAQRGSGGWGVSFSYFSLLPSLSMFEFGAGAASAKGVSLSFRFLFSSIKK